MNLESPFKLPSDVWKKNRDRITRRVRRSLHVHEVNPGPEFNLRFDYLLTAAEVAHMVEYVMNETERILTRYVGKK